ncbi:MAG TPA: DUF1963 domain-containing protein [Actinospica sp.]|nr:DUF1963 domain-containing protein [Actinospica sp.]
MTSTADFIELAHEHLPQRFAERFISLLRPAVVFPGGTEGPDGPGLRCGGTPLLPDDVDWPLYDGRFPMRYVAELDCAAVAAVGGVDLMPVSGHLLFFCEESFFHKIEYPDEEQLSPETPWNSATVLYLPAGTVRRARQTPDRIEELELELYERGAQAASTPPSLNSEFAAYNFGPDAPAMIAAHMEDVTRGGEPSDAAIYPLWAEDFEDGIDDLQCYVQTGGHPNAVQGPVELHAARAALQRDGVAEPDEQAVFDETEHWRVLLQDAIDEDGVTIGYWLLRDDDLAAGRFDRVYFERQH